MRDFLTERETGSDDLVARALARLRSGTTTPDATAPRPDPSIAADATTAPTAPTPNPSVEVILGMPLADFGRRHLALRVKLPDGTQCWFVSGPAEGAVLQGEGVSRGEIWTAAELASVIGAGWTKETIGRLIAVKREFGGTVIADGAP